MVKEVSISKIKNDAEGLFRNGFLCSEAVVSCIRSNFELDLPEEVIAMASTFAAGIGRSKCVCGAVSGGIMCLGYFFGRTKPNDPKVKEAFAVAKELHDWFKDNNSALCCRILTKGMDMAAGENKEQCIKFTGEVARKVAEIVCREKNIRNTDV